MQTVLSLDETSSADFAHAQVDCQPTEIVFLDVKTGPTVMQIQLDPLALRRPHGRAMNGTVRYKIARTGTAALSNGQSACGTKEADVIPAIATSPSLSDVSPETPTQPSTTRASSLTSTRRERAPADRRWQPPLT